MQDEIDYEIIAITDRDAWERRFPNSLGNNHYQQSPIEQFEKFEKFVGENAPINKNSGIFSSSNKTEILDQEIENLKTSYKDYYSGIVAFDDHDNAYIQLLKDLLVDETVQKKIDIMYSFLIQNISLLSETTAIFDKEFNKKEIHFGEFINIIDNLIQTIIAAINYSNLYSVSEAEENETDMKKYKNLVNKKDKSLNEIIDTVNDYYEYYQIAVLQKVSDINTNAHMLNLKLEDSYKNIDVII